MASLEDARRRFYPKGGVQTLLIGESPPAGGSFFYNGNSRLARYTQEGFEKYLGRPFTDTMSFLQYFKSSGFYLEDLCLNPVNYLNRNARSQARRDSEQELASRLITHRPTAVIIVMKGIEANVQRAIFRSDLHIGNVQTIPFPAMGHQAVYVEELVAFLRNKSMTRG